MPIHRVMTTGIKRQHEPPKIVGDLLKAEIDEKTARSIKYQLTIAKCQWPPKFPQRWPSKIPELNGFGGRR